MQAVLSGSYVDLPSCGLTVLGTHFPGLHLQQRQMTIFTLQKLLPKIIRQEEILDIYFFVILYCTVLYYVMLHYIMWCYIIYCTFNIYYILYIIHYTLHVICYTLCFGGYLESNPRCLQRRPGRRRPAGQGQCLHLRPQDCWCTAGTTGLQLEHPHGKLLPAAHCPADRHKCTLGLKASRPVLERASGGHRPHWGVKASPLNLGEAT